MTDERWDRVAESVELLEEGDVEGATRALRALAAAEPGYADAHYWLGRALVRQGQYGPATVAFQMALRQEPTFLGACVELGLAQRELGHLDDAIRAGERALALRDDDPDALHLLGVAHAERGRLDDLRAAEAYLRRFLAQHGMSAEARLDAEVLHRAVSMKLAAETPPN